MVAVAAWFGSRFGRRPALIWTLLVIMLVSLVLSVRTTSTSPSWAYFGLQTRAWELALGGLLAVTVTVWTRLPPAFASQLSWLGLGLIGLSALTYGAATVYPGRAVVMPVLGSAFVIAGGCPGWPHGAELALRQRPMQFLGRTSYSWYLTHWPVLTILPLALGHPLSLDDKWLVVIGSLGLAIAIFYLVEQPIRSPSFAFLIGRPRYGLAFGAVLVSTSIAAALVLSAHTTVFGSGPVNPAAIASPSDQSVVAAAVRAGAALTNLPAHLTPSLAKASGDHPAATGRCLLGDTATRPLPDDQCTFGDPNGSRTVALIGDSHANAWEPAIDAFAKANGYRLVMYAMAACPPGVYPDDVDPTTNRIYTACNEFRAAVFARLRVLRPAYVIVTSELRTLSIDPTGTVQSIHQYQAAGARVIYLEDTPNAQRIGLVPDCLAKHPNAIGQCAMKRDDPATRLGAMIQRRTENQAAQEAGATLLDPTDWFCSSTTCPPIIDDIVVYSDDSHITATYATWLAPVMSAALKKITG
jgi:hypothetical protein